MPRLLHPTLQPHRGKPNVGLMERTLPSRENNCYVLLFHALTRGRQNCLRQGVVDDTGTIC